MPTKKTKQPGPKAKPSPKPRNTKEIGKPTPSKEIAKAAKPVKYGRGQNPNSRKNLIPPEPGEVRNPAGRPVGSRDRATIVRQYMDEQIVIFDPRDPTGRTPLTVSMYEAAMLGQFRAAMNGKVEAWREIQDTLFGKQRIPIDINVEEMSDEELDEFIASQS